MTKTNATAIQSFMRKDNQFLNLKGLRLQNSNSSVDKAKLFTFIGMQMEIPFILENFIGGEFVAPANKQYFNNINPATGA